MKGHIILVLIFAASIFCVNAQDVSINLVNLHPQVFQGTDGIIRVEICNEDTDITLISNRIRPLVSFPNALIHNSAVVQNQPLEDFIILVDDGQSIRFQNITPIPPSTCRTIEIAYTGVNIGGPSTVTGTMGFNGPQTGGNDISNDNSSATILVTFSELIAVDDLAGPVNGYTGQMNILNVKDNDIVNGELIDPADYVVTLVTPDPTGKLTLNPDGTVSLASQTPAGTNTLTYRICEIAVPANCDQAIVSILVAPADIEAVNDSLFSVNGITGGNNLINVLVNDSLNNVPLINNQVILIEVENNTLGVLTLNAGGNISVSPNTPAGTYEITYRICEILNPANCDDATVVVEILPAEIIAVDDGGGPVNGFTGQVNILNVIANDSLNGAGVVLDQITITELFNDDENILLFNVATGNVSIGAQTPEGTYSLQYQICENLNPSNCDTATVTIQVETAVIIANDDSVENINGFDGQINAINVLGNDLLNGVAVAPALITLTEVENQTLGVLTLNGDGSVDVAPQTPAGIYSLTYRICENLNPANCDEATVTIAVDAADIIAVDDTGGPVNGLTGQVNILNVLDNDLLNNVPVNLLEITLTEVENSTMGILILNFDGSVDLAANTPAGIYTFTYEICEVLNPSNCDTALVTINAASAVIVAVDDEGGPVNGFDGQADILNVLANDFLNGDPVILPNVIISEVLNTNPGVLVLNENTGYVSISPQTAAGQYQLTYRICEMLNPLNCDDAIVTVEVEATAIIAVDDEGGPVNGYSGQTNVLNVFDNDLLNGAPVSSVLVSLSQVLNTTMGALLLNPDGSVDVAPQTAAGQYQLTYRICELLNPANCDEAVVTIVVEAAEIVAVNDEVENINGFTGQSGVLNVLNNDLLNGEAVDPVRVMITTVVPDPEGRIILNPDGSVDVLAQTREGIYSLTYQICEVLNPSNCDTASVDVGVIKAEILAVDDNAIANGTDGGVNIINVLNNDLLNGSPVNPAHVNVSIITADPNGYISLNPNGSVDLEAGTPEGTYTITYEICEILNTDPLEVLFNCDTAVVAIDVFIRPDLTPTLEIDNLEFLMANQERDFVVNIYEIENAEQIDGTSIVLRISKLSAYVITYEEESGLSNVIGGIQNSNSDWFFTENSNFITVTAKPGVTIGRSGAKTIGFTIRRNVGVPPNTKQNITATILFGSAGEVVFGNNTVETTITAN